MPAMTKASVACGADGILIEVHPDPEKAPSDGPNAWPLQRMAALLETLVLLDRAVKARPFDEDGLGS